MSEPHAATGAKSVGYFTVPDLLLVAAGGMVGTLGRVAIGAAVGDASLEQLPWATLAVNLIGALLLGVLTAVWAGQDRLRLVIGTGALGGFTTYSGLATEAAQRYLAGHLGLAFGYAALTLMLGLALSLVGMRIGALIARKAATRGEGAREGALAAAGNRPLLWAIGAVAVAVCVAAALCATTVSPLPVVFAIAAAGGVGAALRMAVDRVINAQTNSGFPWGLLVVNLSGSYLLGLVVGLSTPQPWLALLATGLLGGFTTFSSASLDTARLVLARRWLPAIGSGLCVLIAALALAALSLFAGAHLAQ